MFTDPLILYFIVSAFVVLGFGFLLSAFKLPVFIGYILAGVLLGPYTFGFYEDLEVINQLGSIGVVLLLFFIGMEVSPRDLLAKWRIALFGTTLQISVTVALVAALGYLFAWPINRIILLGFVISLSCTAVVVDYMKQKREEDSEIYKNLVAILIAQDVLMVPMLVILGLIGGEQIESSTIVRQLFGSILVVVALVWVMRSKRLKIPFIERLESNHELHVFSALLFCFALSFITGILYLSTALGSFIAGLIIGRTAESRRVRTNLESIKVIFVALFFGSVGALINPAFLMDYLLEITVLLALLFVVNTLINAGILKLLGCTADDSLYGGALLAHIGEFSFVLAAIGLNSMIVSEVAYQITIAVIALSLLFGPMWVAVVRRLLPATASDSRTNS